ncbi:phospholipase A2 [Nonomuraea harbinensis]|uniref:Phospholipase A2 n=1 Tax=Nonomuraea harbinensis TaxID=1286938 RepID=A0ABW1BZ40_9ACTN|nr:phospholipase A2 [Nonomuraea harbinensis]
MFRRWAGSVLSLVLLAGLLHVQSPETAAASARTSAAAPMTPAALTDMWAGYGDAGGHWTGGDSTVTVPLPDGRIAWLFSDTFLGTVNPDHSRPRDTPMVNNTLVVQNGTNLGPTLHGGTASAPTALVRPSSGSDFYWLGDATVEGNTLKVVYGSYTATGDGTPLGFRLTGNVLATFALPGLTLSSVKVLPVSGKIGWGSSILEDGVHTYIYGSESSGSLKFTHVARVTAGNLSGAWEYWTGSAWSAQESASARLLSGVGEGMSVTKEGNQYVLVTQENNEIFSNRIVAYAAGSPTGPFTGPTYLLEAVEPKLDPNQFVYVARVHPELSAPGKLLISYDVNTFDIDAHYRDVRIYRPRFKEVTWPPPTPDPAATPGAPTGLRVTATSDGMAQLTWTAPPGSDLDYWIYRRDVTAGQTHLTRIGAPADTTSYLNAGLEDGHTYTYQVSAVTVGGVEGPPTPVVSIGGRRTAPAAPTGLRATATDTGDVDLTWTAAESEVRYRVYQRDVTAGETLFTEVPVDDPAATGATLTGLARTHTFEFKVTAVNTVGESPPTNLARVTLTLAPPAAPTGLTAKAESDGAVTLSWTAAARADVYWIHRRDVTAGETGFTKLDAPVEETTTKVEPLLSGNTYEFKVSAGNEAGEGPAGNTVSVTARVAPPAAPAGLKATPLADGTVELSWTPSPGARAYWIDRRDVSAGHTTFTRVDAPVEAPPAKIGSLIDGNTYEFKVVAVGDGGEGAASAVVSAVAKVTPPSAPTGLKAVAGDQSVRLTWTAPTGAEMFWVYARDVTAGAAFARLPYPVQEPALTVEPLVNSHVYEFKVSGISQAGEGPAGAVVRATPAPQPPPKVTGLTAAAQAGGTVKLAWTAIPDVYYWVYRRDVTAGESAYTKFGYPAVTASAELGPFTAGHVYDFKVAATDAVGDGPDSDPVRVTVPGTASAARGTAKAGPAILSAHADDPEARPEAAAVAEPAVPAGERTVLAAPAAPKSLRVTGTGDGYVDLAWSPGAASQVVFYWVQFRSKGNSTWYTFGYPTTALSARLTTPLWNDFLYDFRVVAENADGMSGPSNVVTTGPKSVRPTAPKNLRASGGYGYVHLSWDPSDTPYAYYWVHFKSASSSTWYYFAYPTIGTSVRLTYPLWTGYSYDFRVVAVNRWGASEPGNTVRSGPTHVYPYPPDNPRVSSAIGSIKIDWNPSPTPGVMYRVYWRPVFPYYGSWTRSKYPTTKTSMTLKWVAPIRYEIKVAAVNPAGERDSVVRTAMLLMPKRQMYNQLMAFGAGGRAWWYDSTFSRGYYASYTFDWDSDGCSMAPDKPYVGLQRVDFKDACLRHDFGYRNAKKMGFWGYGAKTHTDLLFLQDLYHACDSQLDRQYQALCGHLAVIYYEAVKKYGD